jgi:hypothetical protein
MTDAINSPAHYVKGKIEVIEAIEDWGLNYHRGNCIKYIARAGKKDATKEIEDLGKAKWYLEREIERLQAVKEGRDPVRPNDMNPKPTNPSVRFFCACGHTTFSINKTGRCSNEACGYVLFTPGQNMSGQTIEVQA